ncbi:MAG: formate dehydrogenase accessory protein FdhE [Ardenticatenaceae bacterium]
MINVEIHPIERVLSALDALIDDNPGFEPVVDFYEELLPIQYEARPNLQGLRLNPEASKAKLKEGVPLLWGEFGEPDSIGSEPNVELFMTLCRLAAQGGNEGGELLMRAFLDGKIDLQRLLAKALLLDRAYMTELARSLQVDLVLLEAISRNTLLPITWAYGTAFAQAMNFSEWSKGYCPVCGAWPTLSELRGRDKKRHLRCGRCATSWRFDRLRCLWCDNSDQKQLGFLFDPDNRTLRIDVCHYCNAYSKTIITFDSLNAEMLLVHDLRTIFLDQMAAGEGYTRPHKPPLVR